MSTNSSEYTAKNIQVLEGLEPVRKRPGMYIGSTDVVGLHECLREIVDNSVDESLAGHAKNVWVILNKDGSATVVDDGRGIPVDTVTGYGKSGLEVVMTKLHAGGKFGGGAYKVSGGLHGVGSSVVNALSTYMWVEVRLGGKLYRQSYKIGAPTTELEVLKLSESKLNELPIASRFKHLTHGTTATFLPDNSIFPVIEFDPHTVLRMLQHRSFIVSGLYFHFFDLRGEEIKETNYYYEGGIVSLVRKLNENKDPIHQPIYIKKEVNEVMVEIALQYNDTISENVESFVNVINTINGGSHVTGFKMALTRSINEYGKKQNAFKSDADTVTGEDAREGLTAIVAIRMEQNNIQFEGQTKGKLGNSEIQPLVAAIVKEGLDNFFEENPNEGRLVLGKTMLAVKARLAAKAAKEAILRKGAFEGGALPGKLADCQEKDASKSELFIVEGDSAGGSAKTGRDRKFQAILPLRGKILNTERARIDKVMEHEGIKDLIIALGMGIGESINLDKLRYHRIIIMTDADVDGEHIATLLLTFFFRHLPQIIENGYLYIAKPPLYKVTIGKKFWYVYNDAEKDKIIKLHGATGNIGLQRYKGLGEMNPDQLAETTMQPEKRVLKKIDMKDVEEVDRVFTMLMGEDVPPRKHFIQENATNANLDI